MKVLCDVHIPLRLVKFLQLHGVEAYHVNNILDSFYTSDGAVATYADKHQLIEITKDVDFRNAYFLSKSPQRLIRVCLGNMATKELNAIFEKYLELLKKSYHTTARFYIEISRENALVINS
ncbi:DUF5615 family PIN-like protein [Pontibacter sp. E15-1]|uniref:DUF5615 family PIN-like protein n=1 Tax=Pontibacter sp. E15-1 TaxID=2919918 RepID=UPI001F4FB259|nr:DUF5615 family PIN-like protein [Pontibacter sp. E15-1]MCJ8167397.1 DUF5615 family PIN-like protein [Pontibacter sp. E15-1]